MTLLSIPLLAVVISSSLVFYKFIIHPAFISPLAKIPNAHWTCSFSPIWILWTRYRCCENRTVHAAHLKHGSVIRLGPNELSINDVDGLRKVYAGGFEKGQWYSIFDNYNVPCMFSSWYSRPHSSRKRMISNIYSKSNLHTSAALARQAQVILYDRLLPILTAASTPERFPNGVDILELWNATTMDFITAYQFGLKNASNFLQNETYRRHWLSLYHSRKTHTFFSQELPRLTKFFKSIGVYLVPTWVDDANQELESWCKDRCDETTKYINKNSKDFEVGNEPVVMDAIISGIAKEDRTKGQESVLYNTTLQKPELSIASEMIDHLAAGHETSGITLTYLAWHLSQDVNLQTRLREELLSLSPNMSLSSESSTKQIPNSKDLDALPILHAVLMETLRLDASIPGGQPRMTPFPSCTLGSYNVPGGVRVGAQAHSIHRNKAVYPEPEKWNYTRWMDEENGYTEEQRKERDRWFWAFSSGGRMCVGSNFAMHEIKLVIAAVYSNFKTTIEDDEGIEQEDGYTCGPRSNKLFLKFEKV